MSKNVSFHASVKTLDSRYATPSWKHFTQVEMPEIHRIYRKCYIFVIYIVISTIDVLISGYEILVISHSPTLRSPEDPHRGARELLHTELQDEAAHTDTQFLS